MTAKHLLFTELALNRLSVEGTYWDTNTRAFGCRVGKRRKTLFIVRSDGTREIVGHIPGIDVKTARRRAQELLLSRYTPRPSQTLQDAFETYKATYLHNYRDRSRKEVIRLVEKHLGPLWTDKLLDITHHQIADIFDAIAPSEANHLFGVLRTFFKWAEKRELSGNPMSKLDRPHKTESRSRILSEDEIRKIWLNCTSPTAFNSIIKLALLTGQRRGELAAIDQNWIKDGSITFPSHITKNGHEHTIPFSSLCVMLSKSITPGYNAWSQPKKRLDNRTGVADYTLHDLRRTWASLAAMWGIPEHIAARIQNHRTAQHQNPIRAIYQRYEFRDEMKEAMELFERRLLNEVLTTTNSSSRPIRDDGMQ